ncbi:tRNA-histidine guanylyltransferase 1-like [Coemansia guatemalensis]|uniref:tRNA-histidine guanylyltransferase 1-like n=1 Tax=Coemansia guatemalensis TaxID=2761395 RepID=A0A9W8HUQ6_9FUNG|nr:tRNA-histidine guanylyltransferase 1-like [Coemansia guatemalensis]
MYPSDRIMRDYLCWRQADCHINNMYNTCFWMLVQKGGMTEKEAEKRLKVSKRATQKDPGASHVRRRAGADGGTLSRDKNELLFSEYGINYNAIEDIFKKGSVVIRDRELIDVVDKAGKSSKRSRGVVRTLHCDIIKDAFWNSHPEILRGKLTGAQRKEERARQREVELAAEASAAAAISKDAER